MNDFRRYIGRRVLIFTADTTFEGTLASAGKDVLILDGASVLADDNDRRPLDGQLVVPGPSVQWVQVP